MVSIRPSVTCICKVSPAFKACKNKTCYKYSCYDTQLYSAVCILGLFIKAYVYLVFNILCIAFIYNSIFIQYKRPLRASENVFEKREQTEAFKEYYSTRLNKQVFVYMKSFVSMPDLNEISTSILMEKVVLYDDNISAYSFNFSSRGSFEK